MAALQRRFGRTDPHGRRNEEFRIEVSAISFRKGIEVNGRWRQAEWRLMADERKSPLRSRVTAAAELNI